MFQTPDLLENLNGVYVVECPTCILFTSLLTFFTSVTIDSQEVIDQPDTYSVCFLSVFLMLGNHLSKLATKSK
jgi:hypothetical protein